MLNLNKTQLTGRLVADPHDLEHTSNGVPYCRFRIANESGFSDSKKTIFVSVTAWRKSAEWCAEYLKKGTAVYVEGRLEEEKWESEKTQTKHEKFRISAQDVQFNESKREADARDERREDRQESEPAGATVPSTSDDDLPF